MQAAAIVVKSKLWWRVVDVLTFAPDATRRPPLRLVSKTRRTVLGRRGLVRALRRAVRATS